MSLVARSTIPVVVAYGTLLALGLFATQWFSLIQVAGGSMMPALTPGDVVVVMKSELPEQGDIALLRSGQSLVLHRVIGVRGDGSINTRGDANPVADFTATRPSAVRGRVVAVLPIGAAVARWRRGGAYGTLPAQTHSTRR